MLQDVDGYAHHRQALCADVRRHFGIDRHRVGIVAVLPPFVIGNDEAQILGAARRTTALSGMREFALVKVEMSHCVTCAIISVVTAAIETR